MKKAASSSLVFRPAGNAACDENDAATYSNKRGENPLFTDPDAFHSEGESPGGFSPISRTEQRRDGQKSGANHRKQA